MRASGAEAGGRAGEGDGVPGVGGEVYTREGSMATIPRVVYTRIYLSYPREARYTLRCFLSGFDSFPLR